MPRYRTTTPSHRAADETAPKAKAVTSASRLRPATLACQVSFAAWLAHELRSPLATQRALLELALSDTNADLITWREIGEDVLDACMHQEQLLEALLSLARSHKGPQRFEPVDLVEITDAVLRDHHRPGLTTVVTLEPARTAGDPRLIECLTANLISNAIRHNHPGGRIDIATRTAAERAVLSISNTGPRIPSDVLPRLFQPFQRLDPSQGSAQHGLGLGLAIVEGIAHAHGALVAARARDGGGLEMNVSFPRMPRPRSVH